MLNKMPKVWEAYLSFSMQQPFITRTRQIFDRAFRALPTTQHNRLWRRYCSFAHHVGGPISLHISKRYVLTHPDDVEDLIYILLDLGRYAEVVSKYTLILNDPQFRSKKGKSRFQLWTDMVDVIVTHAAEIDIGKGIGIDFGSVIRSGIEQFADQRGRLWVALATYWISMGKFERARDIYEEGISTVMTVRDFTLIFDSYAEFEESVMVTLMDKAAVNSDDHDLIFDADSDLDIRMMRFEQLMDRRPFLVNDVLLRQNPSNVSEWEKRILLWGDNKQEIVKTYTGAIAAVHPKQAVGSFHTLWISFSRFYENGNELQHARSIMEKAVKVPFKSVANLAEVWCEWAELELRNGTLDDALEVLKRATRAPKRLSVDIFNDGLSPQQRVHKSWKLWSFYADLVESIKPLDEARKTYDRIFELRVATPQTVINYANLMEENRYFEESFRIYERGLGLFSYPVAFELWNSYLTKAVDHKIGIERLRDLFEQALENCPPKFAKSLYLMYGGLEEKRGLARHAMRIYERATRAVTDEDRFEIFKLYVTKSMINFGLVSTRPIYERGISALPDKEARDMCLRFAEMELKLGEIDRARAVYGHASQFCDPRTSPVFWSKWETFEVQHGNEDTFKDMLRIKRSVQAQFKLVSRVATLNSTDLMQY